MAQEAPPTPAPNPNPSPAPTPGDPGAPPPNPTPQPPPGGKADPPKGETAAEKRIRELNDKAKAAEERAKEAERKASELERAQMGEKERAEAERDEAKQEAEKLKAENLVLTRGGWARTAAQGAGFIDPEDAVAHLDLASLDSEQKVTNAVKKLAEQKPHLVGQSGGVPRPGFGNLGGEGQPAEGTVPTGADGQPDHKLGLGRELLGNLLGGRQG